MPCKNCLLKLPLDEGRHVKQSALRTVPREWLMLSEQLSCCAPFRSVLIRQDRFLRSKSNCSNYLNMRLIWGLNVHIAMISMIHFYHLCWFPDKGSSEASKNSALGKVSFPICPRGKGNHCAHKRWSKRVSVVEDGIIPGTILLTATLNCIVQNSFVYTIAGAMFSLHFRHPGSHSKVNKSN